MHPRNGGQDKNVAVDVSGCAAPGTVQGHIRADTTSHSVTQAVASDVRRGRHDPGVSTDTAKGRIERRLTPIGKAAPSEHRFRPTAVSV